MPEKPTPEEFNSPIENPENQELSPEVLDLVMAKVQDINTEGIGFSVTDKYKNSLERVLEKGLLGSPGATTDTSKWAEEARKEKDKLVFFNITGRYVTPSREWYKNARAEDEYDERYGNFPASIKNVGMLANGIHILFDMKSFHEDPRGVWESDKKTRQRLPHHHYAIHGEGGGQNSEGQTLADSRFGFALKQRIAPRFFTGIVLNLQHVTKRVHNIPRQGDYTLNYKDYSNEDNLAKAKEISELMRKLHPDKPELWLPVYDANGNLLWPKPMFYEQVKKYVAKSNNTEAENE